MILVKVGGGRDISFKEIAKDLVGRKAVVVLGANFMRDRILDELNLSKEVVTSMSGVESVLSTNKMIEVMMMTYSGLAAQQFVECCQQNGVNAISLSGADGALVRGNRNKGIRTIVDGKKRMVHDLSGKPQSVNVELLNILLDNGFTPVITMPILDENNVAINSENDDLTALLANELRPSEVVFLIEEEGVMEEGNLIKSIAKSDLERLSNDGRFVRKAKAVSRITSRVRVSDGRVKKPITKAIEGEGTTLIS